MSRKIDALSRSDDDPYEHPYEKKLLRNVANALLNKTAPIVKAGLLGPSLMLYLTFWPLEKGSLLPQIWTIFAISFQPSVTRF
ncbi:hypothetical protein DSO57_1038598 [Entomophthora muscae]|uniref:Uncharacterized protein n=1 Tax=Entomophthora muscae TaxID=34485 RepID=A0ACC2S0L7_9FUNG|nr:hypothetical protein DSO57_1038598 [Entomophthora muscae]